MSVSHLPRAALSRRDLLQKGVGFIAAVLVPSQVRAETGPREIRIGYQKSSVLAVVREQGLIEKRFPSAAVRWAEFQFGPPLLEALTAGRVDYGYTGNAPPIFAQVGRSNFRYVAALPGRGDNVAILTHQDSNIRAVADLKGRKVAVGKGSSGHEFLLSALDAAGVPYSAIQPAYLAPADGGAAFARGAVDAWSIWDPYLAIAEVTQPAQPLPIDRSISRQDAFFFAQEEFANSFPDVVHGITADIATSAAWTAAHRADAVTLYAKATGVSVEALTKSVGRTEFTVSPMTEEIVLRQQAVADRFLKAGLIPHPVDVRSVVWRTS